MRFFYAGYDVSGNTDNIATAYIPSGDGWHREIALELAPLAETVDVFVSTSEWDGHTTQNIYRDGRATDAVEIDGVVYAIYAVVPS